MTTATVVRPAASSPRAAIYASLFTAVAALAFVLLFQAKMPFLYIPAFLLTGVGPVLGYQLAAGRLGSDWMSILGGLLGFIVLIFGFILWPILVGAMTKGQSVGRLFLWSLLGIIAGVALFLVIGTVLGQDPVWVGPGWIFLWATWGAFAGAAMTHDRMVTVE